MSKDEFFLEKDPRTGGAELLLLVTKSTGAAVGGADLRQAALTYGLRSLAATDVVSMAGLQEAAGCAGQCSGCGSIRGENNVPFHWYYCARGEARLVELLRTRRYRVIVVSGLSSACYLGAMRNATSAKIVFDEHNAEADLLDEMHRCRNSDFKDQFLPGGTVAALEAFEREAITRADVVTVCSAVDRSRLHRRYGNAKSVYVVQNAVQVLSGSRPTQTQSPERVFFLGKLGYFPNLVAAEHIVTHIGPLIASGAGDVPIIIAGHNAPAGLVAIAAGGPVQVKSSPAEVDPLFHRAVMIVPLTIGGGSRLKILQAFAAGTSSVVASQKAIEGIEATPARHFLLADEPEDYASAVQQIRSDPEGDLVRRREAWDLTNSRYSWPAVAESLVQVLKSVGW